MMAPVLTSPTAVALVTAASLFGCSPAPEDPDRNSTLTVLVDCCAADQMRLYNLKHLLFLHLVRHGLEPDPQLAESWEHSPDYRTWTFHLRRDVRWHDGVPLTAHDVAFSIELFRHPHVLFAPWIWQGIDSVSVPDDHTIAFVRPEPAYHPPVAGKYFPKHLLQDLDPASFYEWEFWTRPVGNGPYRFVRYVPRTMIEFEANPDFYGGEPPIKRVVAKLSSANRVIELTSGAADAATDLTAADVLKLEADPRFRVYYQNDWTELFLVYWNHRHPLFADAGVRRALSHAIDRRELARVVTLPDEVPLVAGLGTDGGADPDGRRAWNRIPAYDPQRAQRLLDRAGWTDQDGDGIRERAGREARFTMLAPQGGSLAAEAIALFMQNQWRQVGVAVDIRPMEMGVVRSALRSGRFEAAIIWENQDAHTILWTWFGGPADPGPDETGDPPYGLGYSDPEAARLIERASVTTPGSAEEDTLYLRFNEILQRDMPVMILFPGVYRYAAHRRIRGFRQGDEWLTHPEELWIDPDWEIRPVQKGES
ncbi:MAG TPA: ABC transporter substrate-binding protein [Longimicrobiales bacterium]|nr:ABC transporter substrate-binding protein [Longimicrobiales bacterium]